MKKVLMFSVLMTLIVATCVIVILTTQNTNKPVTTNNTKDNPPTVFDDIKLDQISFNGIKIGDKVKEEMKNIVMDARRFKYEYEDIFINTDEEDNITYLGFHTMTDTYGNVTQSLNDVAIKYEDKSLKTLDDFKKEFGDGEEFERGKDYYSIRYTDGNLNLELYVHDEKLNSVDLELIK